MCVCLCVYVCVFVWVGAWVGEGVLGGERGRGGEGGGEEEEAEGSRSRAPSCMHGEREKQGCKRNGGKSAHETRNLHPLHLNYTLNPKP